MKKLIFIALIFVFLISGCQFKENYSMTSSFSNEIITKTVLEVEGSVVTLELPFADFSCDVKSFKPTLDRKAETFTIVLEGTEATERCSQKFSTEITGLEKGDYWLKVIYRKEGQDIEAYYQPFNIFE